MKKYIVFIFFEVEPEVTNGIAVAKFKDLESAKMHARNLEVDYDYCKIAKGYTNGKDYEVKIMQEIEEIY